MPHYDVHYRFTPLFEDDERTSFETVEADDAVSAEAIFEERHENDETHLHVEDVIPSNPHPAMP